MVIPERPRTGAGAGEDIFRPLDVAAVADVDRSLIWAMMERSPLENLAAGCQHARDRAAA